MLGRALLWLQKVSDRRERRQLESLCPGLKDFDPGPPPKVSRETVDRWIERCRVEGKNHILVIHEHNYCDDLREVYPYYAADDVELTRRVRLVDRGYDATALQIIDLDRDIDSQLKNASFIERIAA